MTQEYYHISKTYLGKEYLFTPRIPQSSLISVEGNIPRICVSDNILKCIRSMTGMHSPDILDITSEFIFGNDDCSNVDQLLLNGNNFVNPAIYYTQNIPFLPPNISDFRYNSEMWFLQPELFQFKGYLNLSQLISGNFVVSESATSLTKKEYIDRKNEELEILLEKNIKNKNKKKPQTFMLDNMEVLIIED